MKLKELKCKNCGATLEVEENATQVKCKFCHTSFAVEDAYSEGYKYEKGRLKAQNEHLEEKIEKAQTFLKNSPIPKIFAAQYLITAGIGLIIFIIVIVTFISIAFSFNKKEDVFENDPVINDVEDVLDDFEVNRFNTTFEMYQGTEYGSSVGRLLDKVITNNKKNEDNHVTVEFKETSTQDPEELKNLKKQFDEWTEYEVSFEYNDEGLIYLVLIED